MVPDVTVDVNSINGNNVTLTLSWGEPFNNDNPILHYIVTCVGPSCPPPDVTTTDNSIRSHTFTSLVPRKNYTFTVRVMNSNGNGVAGKVRIVTPGEFICLFYASILCI